MLIKESFLNTTLKFLFAIIISLTVVSSVYADVWVDGYYRKDGTYVRGHYRSDPDGNFENNWSTKGNVNPYTGEVGTKTNPNSTNSSTNNSYYVPKNSTYSYSSDNSSGSEEGSCSGLIQNKTDSVRSKCLDRKYKTFNAISKFRTRDKLEIISI